MDLAKLRGARSSLHCGLKTPLFSLVANFAVTSLFMTLHFVQHTTKLPLYVHRWVQGVLKVYSTSMKFGFTQSLRFWMIPTPVLLGLSSLCFLRPASASMLSATSIYSERSSSNTCTYSRGFYVRKYSVTFQKKSEPPLLPPIRKHIYVSFRGAINVQTVFSKFFDPLPLWTLFWQWTLILNDPLVFTAQNI